MDQPLADLHTVALINLGQQFAAVTRLLAQHRADYDRATHLVSLLRSHQQHAFAAPPSLPLNGSYAPSIITADLAASIDIINASGHTVIQSGDRYQITPPDSAGDFAMTFPLEQRP